MRSALNNNKRLSLFVFLLACFIPVSASQAKKDHSQTVQKQKINLCPVAQDLPHRVRKMQKNIYKATRSGDREYFLEVFEMNELPPVLKGKRIDNFLEFLQNNSADKKGFELMARISGILETRCAVLKNGTDARMYIWPGWVHTSLNKLKPYEKVALFRLAESTDTALKILQSKKYTGLSLGIGEDGTWHFLSVFIPPAK